MTDFKFCQKKASLKILNKADIDRFFVLSFDYLRTVDYFKLKLLIVCRHAAI